MSWPVVCTKCGGSGDYEICVQDGSDYRYDRYMCDRCHGKGTYDDYRAEAEQLEMEEKEDKGEAL